MSDIETTKTFRRIMDGEQKELESKIRSLLIDFEKRAGRILWVKFSNKNEVLFSLERLFVGENETKAAIEHLHTNPQLYHS